MPQGTILNNHSAASLAACINLALTACSPHLISPFNSFAPLTESLDPPTFPGQEESTDDEQHDEKNLDSHMGLDVGCPNSVDGVLDEEENNDAMDVEEDAEGEDNDVEEEKTDVEDEG